jgi:hypothetical protein
MTLDRVLAPHDRATFFATTFEQAPLHIERNDPAYFEPFYGLADVETALHVGATDPSQFAMTKHGAMVDPSALQVERTKIRAAFTGKPPVLVLDPRAVAAHFESGHTLVVKDAALFSPSVQALCNRIQRETLIYAQANAYLTPPNERGFGLHYDTHDTLVLQIEGTKDWHVREPLTQLPIESQPSGRASDTGRMRTYTLRPGDTLYVPRGYRHECTAGAAVSLHLTFALLPVRAIELLESAIKLAATVDVEFRRALPIGWHDAADFPERFGALMAERLRAALTGPVVNAARTMVLNDLFASTRVAAENVLTDIARLDALDATTRVALRDDAPFTLRPEGADVQLVAAGKATALPAACMPALRALGNGALAIAEIERLFPGAGVALVRLLVIDGLATIVD